MVIALVMTPTALPLAYEVMDGNTSDKTTLRSFPDKIESMYDKARRVWLIDRGSPTEAILAQMRTSRQETFYLVGTSRAKVKQYEKKWLKLPWRKVRAMQAEVSQAGSVADGVGAAKTDVGRAFGFVKINLPHEASSASEMLNAVGKSVLAGCQQAEGH